MRVLSIYPSIQFINSSCSIILRMVPRLLAWESRTLISWLTLLLIVSVPSEASSANFRSRTDAQSEATRGRASPRTHTHAPHTGVRLCYERLAFPLHWSLLCISSPFIVLPKALSPAINILRGRYRCAVMYLFISTLRIRKYIEIVPITLP